jgi:hypothetical protein
MVNSMSDTGRTRVAELKARYQLENSVGRNKKDSINLSRVAMTFPWIACEYARFAENPVVPAVIMDQYIPGYPRPMLHPAFSAIIPRSLGQREFEVILSAYLLCQCRFASIVGKKA